MFLGIKWDELCWIPDDVTTCNTCASLKNPCEVIWCKYTVSSRAEIDWGNCWASIISVSLLLNVASLGCQILLRLNTRLIYFLIIWYCLLHTCNETAIQLIFLQLTIKSSARCSAKELWWCVTTISNSGECHFHFCFMLLLFDMWMSFRVGIEG